jgi:hypothetical protein
MEEIAGDSIAQYRFNMTLMSIFGGVALLLAVIGTYGVLSYQVGRRTVRWGSASPWERAAPGFSASSSARV